MPCANAPRTNGCMAARKLGKRVVTHGYKSNITIAANLAFLSQHDDDEPCEYSTSQSQLR
jgi:L-rhamnonate dehydratase